MGDCVCSSRPSAVAHARALYPAREIVQQLSDDARIVVFEPIGDLPGAWNEVPEASYGIAGKGDDQLRHST